jgi:hypothetical protein
MYHSGVTVADAIAMLSNEVDIVGDIPASSYLRWVSALEQLIYSDLIADERSATLSVSPEYTLGLNSVSTVQGEKKPTFDDVRKVYRDGEELTRVGLATAHQFGDEKAVYFKKGDYIGVSEYAGNAGDIMTVIWRCVPTVKTKDSEEILVPYEWLDMVLAKMRGEAYKIANDDAQAAKWLGDYNAQMESFRLWAAERGKRYGE